MPCVVSAANTITLSSSQKHHIRDLGDKNSSHLPTPVFAPLVDFS